MIFTERTITIRNDSSSINAPVILYRGDKNVEVRFTLVESPYKYSNRDSINIIESTDASYAQLVIKTPNGRDPIFGDITAVGQSNVIFMIGYDMIDEIEEVGTYDFQIRLFDANQTSMATIPEVTGGFIIKEPIAKEDTTNNITNSAIVGSAVVTSDVSIPTFVGGSYNKTAWDNGTVISRQKLDKIEDGIYETYELSKDNSSQIKEKADKTTTNNIQQQVDNLVLGAVGDGNNAEVVQARGSFNVLNSRLNNIDHMKNIIIGDITELKNNVNGEITNLPLEYKYWNDGLVSWSTNTLNKVATINPVTIEVGDIIKLKDTENYRYVYYVFDNDGNKIERGSWSTSDITVNDNSTLANRQVYFQFKRADNKDIEGWELQVISNNFSITRPKNALTRLQNLSNKVDKLQLGIDTLVDIKVNNSVGEIASGNYYQLVDGAFGDNTMPYHLLVKTTDTTGNFGDYICLRQKINDDRNARRINSIYIGDGYYYVEGFTYDSTTSGYGKMEIFIDLRASSQSLTVEYYKLLQPGTKSSNSESGEVILYVSPNGNDSNDGLIPSSPLATIKKAIQKGATTVLCKRGNYYNQPPIEFTEQYGKTLKILPYENNRFNSTVLSRPLINLINGNTLNNLTSSNGLLTQTLTPNDHIKDVFINKTKPPIDTSNTRSAGYYSTVWQLHEDNTLDAKLKPVLTLAECKAEVGTFFHDGTNIYINPFDTTYTSFVLPNKSTQIQLTGYSELVLEDIVCQFSYNQNFILHNNMNMTIRNCHSKYTMLADGFSLNNCNGNFYNCTAFKSRNDGFNIHAYGVTNFYNCSGYYNYDDGISHHDGCNGVIDGGEWHHNGKGGVSSPTHGAYIDIYNVECYNNNYGVYAASSSDRRQCSGRVFNSVLYNNTSADIILEKAKIKLYNTKYTTKSISGNSDTEFIEL